MLQAQNRETVNSTWKVASVLQDHYDDVRDKIVFHKTTPDLQEQDHSVQDQDQDRYFFGLRPVKNPDRSCPKTDGLRPHRSWL